MFLASLVLGALLEQPSSGPAPSPYAGQESGSIKALSDDEARAYRDGAGMGLAKAAELNHYPGPKHVLDLASELGLDAGQRATVQASFDRMHAEAVRLGAAILEKEAALNGAFADGAITADALRALTSEIGRLHGELRAAHLLAHLETRAVLSAEQVARYDRLRGYGLGGHDEHEGHRRHQP